MKKKDKSTYEELLDFVEEEGVEVIDFSLPGSRLKGLYCDGTIGLSKNLQTTAEKASILAEELGHYKTSAGNIIDQSNPANIKQEYRARAWGYDKSVGLRGIVNCYLAHCHSLYEMAECLNVTESYLIDVLAYYHGKYGSQVTYKDYVIYFEPTLGVLELK